MTPDHNVTLTLTLNQVVTHTHTDSHFLSTVFNASFCSQRPFSLLLLMIISDGKPNVCGQERSHTGSLNATQ